MNTNKLDFKKENSSSIFPIGVSTTSRNALFTSILERKYNSFVNYVTFFLFNRAISEGRSK